MPIYATNAAKEFWGKTLKPATRARSLAAAKFVSIAENKNDKSWRKDSCEAIEKGAALAAKATAFAQFTNSFLAQGSTIIHAKLEARLIIDSGGGVIENGGICLDRISCLPFIPGSAVKGCARRFAVRQLSEETDPGAKARLLAQIAIIFGYGDQEWQGGRRDDTARSDFWLAMVPIFDAGRERDAERNALWNTVSEQAATLIFEFLGRIPKEPEQPLAPQLPSLSGIVSFLPAYPDKDPGIQIDVLTPHHPDYQSGKKDRSGNLVKPIATDDEDPNPVLFPTVAPGAIFRFPLVSLDRGAWASCPRISATSKPLELGGTWLAESLELFGLGAKTNAGYGWFAVTDENGKLTSKPNHQEQEQADDHPFVTAWQGKLANSANFRVALPKLAEISDVTVLHAVFCAVIPEGERNRMKRNQPYWQAFSSNPSGRAILERLSLKLN